MVEFQAIIPDSRPAVLALLIGVLVTAGFLLPAGEPKKLRKTLIVSALALLLLFLVIACLSLLIQGAKLRDGAMPSLEILSRYLSMPQCGKVCLFREGY